MRGNHLAEEIKEIEKKAKVKAVAFAIFGIFVFTFIHTLVWGYGIWSFVSFKWIIPSLFWSYLMYFFYKMSIKRDPKRRALLSGLSGEMKAKSIFDGMKGYKVFNQVFVRNPASRTRTTEIGFVLVGKNAVFVVEIKNNSGQIYMDDKAERWEVDVSSRGRVIASSMRNPIRQAKIQAGILERELRVKMGSAKAPTVIPIVGFTSDNAVLMTKQGMEPSIPVFSPPMTKTVSAIQSIDASSVKGWSLKQSDVAAVLGTIMKEGELANRSVQRLKQ